ncbi:MAG: diguanylate cyclase [Thiobacillaceae bacterium]|nr:diguanylate cyclase [Thiobacillaceae bacterium]MCX7673610.1 diguanylate cyclase [Thiobacillaceae bacterium]MDW8324790.1 diguanylate cyclase [Burkholderiales bacterium]
MDLITAIRTQIEAVRLPVYAVTLTALTHPHTPVLLQLHWHGFRCEPAAAGRRSLHPVPSSLLQLNEAWRSLQELEQSLLEAAWQLGAWDLQRSIRRACNDVAASAREAVECAQAFGSNPFAPLDEALTLAEAPDRLELMQLAAHKGYVRWLFRPVRGGIWRATAEDETLDAEGGRAPPCPVRAEPMLLGRNRGRIYRLGRLTRLIVPTPS